MYVRGIQKHYLWIGPPSSQCHSCDLGRRKELRETLTLMMKNIT